METVCEADWVEAAKLAALQGVREILLSVIEAALSVAVSNDLFARLEGAGVWNSSRAPHCYGYEYEQCFGKPFCLADVSAVHQRVWRKSAWWPNLPPTAYFYDDHLKFEKQCEEEFEERAKQEYKEELLERKKRRKIYDLAYNEVRRKRRRDKKEARVNYINKKYGKKILF